MSLSPHFRISNKMLAVGVLVTFEVWSWNHLWGFGSVMIPAMLPPPVPIVPFLVAAGAMKYPARKFLAALTLGRGIRYFVVAWLGRSYS